MSGRSLRPRRKAAGQSVLKSNLSHSSQIRKTSRSRSQPRNIEKLQKKGKLSVGTIMIDSDCDSDTEIQEIVTASLKRDMDELDKMFKSYSSDDENDYFIDLTNDSRQDESIDDVIITDIIEPVPGTSTQSQARVPEAVKEKKEDVLLQDVQALLKELKPKQVETPPKKVIVETDTSTPKLKMPECAICLESLVDSAQRVATICGHLFCKSCITLAIKTTHKCPTCRKKLTLKSIHPIYL